jgi:hypothetical protein
MTKAPGANPTLIIHPGNNRLAQVARANRAKLFDEKRKAVFLEWFAATCNVYFSAEKAGIAYQTVYKHRRKDAAFAEAWDEALAQGYAALEAGLLADAIAAEIGKAEDEDEVDELPLHASPLSFEQRMALFKEYRRPEGGRGPRAVGKHPPVPPHIASPAEAEAALIKRLKHFALRVAEADAEGRTVLDPPNRSAKSGVPITKQGGGKGR